MRIEAADYFAAAKDRLNKANLLYEKARYSLAPYIAGVAVESLLRAYIFRLEPKLEAAHNLKLLWNASKLSALATPDESLQIDAAISDLFARWRNDLRYTSNDRLRRRLKRSKFDRGIRGDFLKENCRLAIETATTILKVGVAKWQR
ncbi:MAG: HEPN domain-containing protein [candidate division KSB1 bacterium]|nr:HEPN domain-containing protein [candidate division KSB1 bacterium]MDZ7366769.1 HEPN domain-containing protein [candidate division KSB1 bacterium]MDZ7404781.1 HEPN domain-containing protein [candidate division KSB1 bacterium]